jgi:hypothetical protein
MSTILGRKYVHFAGRAGISGSLPVRGILVSGIKLVFGVYGSSRTPSMLR